MYNKFMFYRVVAMDMRGYSDSDAPSGYSNYKMEYLVADIKQLIPALGLCIYNVF